MLCLFPPHHPLCLEEEVINGKKGNLDDGAINKAATAIDGNKDMPPKAKPTATKGMATLTKPAAAASATTDAAKDTMMPLPVAKKPLVPYFINMCDAAIVSYYNSAVTDYAEVKVQVNGVVRKGSCKFTVTAEWQRTTYKICFTSEHSTSRPS